MSHRLANFPLLLQLLTSLHPGIPPAQWSEANFCHTCQPRANRHVPQSRCLQIEWATFREPKTVKKTVTRLCARKQSHPRRTGPPIQSESRL